MKRWRRSLAAALAALVAGALFAPAALGQGAPDDEQAEEAEESDDEAPPPAPKARKKKGAAVAPARVDAGSKDRKAGPAEAKRGPADKAEPSPEERAARGVAVIERGGQVLGLGAVLAGDGRILTALSPLGAGNDLAVRFPDGTTARVKLGHHDRVWDLALLVPQTGRWTEGLTASSRDPVRPDAQIRSFTAARGKVAAVPLVLRSHRALIGGDDRQLDDAIELGSRISPLDLGAPIIDEDGRVVAVLGRGCAPNEGKPCTPVAFGAPIAAIRSFLRAVPKDAIQPAAWLGIQGVSEASPVAKGVRVTVVHPESPAEQARLKGGDRGGSDMILAVNGVPVTSPEALSDAIRTHAIGEKVPLIVLSGGKYREVTVELRAAPDPRAAGAMKPAAAHPGELPPPGPGAKTTEEYRK
ncbi:S1C family serine protease [Sorangium cellulosum]|uniref:S1C family serine protease n=1 Tax=Sorangium cellulosum TaxID=56 RepID=UPI001F2E091B|nr:S1C family serine protease [Sorangium cellulosum]